MFKSAQEVLEVTEQVRQERLNKEINRHASSISEMIDMSSNDAMDKVIYISDMPNEVVVALEDASYKVNEVSLDNLEEADTGLLISWEEISLARGAVSETNTVDVICVGSVDGFSKRTNVTYTIV